MAKISQSLRSRTNRRLGSAIVWAPTLVLPIDLEYLNSNINTQSRSDGGKGLNHLHSRAESIGIDA